jgi:hypothetical protein
MNGEHIAIRREEIGNITGVGPLGFENTSAVDAPNIFSTFISSILGLMTMIAAIWFLFVFLGGAYGIISAGGNKNAYEEAQKKITSGLIGLVVVIASSFTIDLVGRLIGFDLILDPAQMIQLIGI